jgi:hypothetical protein
MLSYEFARAIQSDRERDIRRAVRERSLRAAGAASQAAVEPPVRRGSEDPAGGTRLATSRLR